MDESAAVYDEWGRSSRASLSDRLGGVAVAGYLKAVYATSRIILSPPDFFERTAHAPDETFIWVFWHRHLPLAPATPPGDSPWTCMASKSRDGEIAVQILARLGRRCVRGSSVSAWGVDKGGGLVLRRMAAAAREGHQLAITPDGPSGPPGKVKMGAISLASLTGCRIRPMAYAASRCLTLSSWDGAILPLPFGRIAIRYGEPLEVPRTRDEDVLEARRAEVERRLIALGEEVNACLAPPSQSD